MFDLKRPKPIFSQDWFFFLAVVAAWFMALVFLNATDFDPKVTHEYVGQSPPITIEQPGPALVATE